MPTGKVKFFNAEKGYGFIERDDGGADVFVHATGLADRLKDDLPDGARVEFDIVTSPKTRKQCAANARVSS